MKTIATIGVDLAKNSFSLRRELPRQTRVATHIAPLWPYEAKCSKIREIG